MAVPIPADAVRITTAKSAGFCFGVDRAVKLVYEALDAGKQVATLGPIVHNDSVVSDLLNRGARIIKGMPSGFYDGYDKEIHELYIF